MEPRAHVRKQMGGGGKTPFPAQSKLEETGTCRPQPCCSLERGLPGMEPRGTTDSHRGEDRTQAYLFHGEEGARASPHLPRSLDPSVLGKTRQGW